ncbi:2'-5' RNA ligase family protein [Haloferula sargassicola]|uniref:2'-5' RNA ligase family protein n=1 Tax=Haloferula sargassicola TaxID=490096 RepID=A0ABP9US87_9BACT
MSDGEKPLILTAAFDAGSQARFEQLRRRYFPPERNFIPAHLTLFHHLPGDQQAAVEQRLREVTSGLPPMSFVSGGTLHLGRGAALRIDSPELGSLREMLARAWEPWLTGQDRQGFRPHVTVQNKVAPDTARATLAALESTDPPPASGSIEGLRLWRYLGGPWEALAEFPFG